MLAAHSIFSATQARLTANGLFKHSSVNLAYGYLRLTASSMEALNCKIGFIHDICSESVFSSSRLAHTSARRYSHALPTRANPASSPGFSSREAKAQRKVSARRATPSSSAVPTHSAPPARAPSSSFEIKPPASRIPRGKVRAVTPPPGSLSPNPPRDASGPALQGRVVEVTPGESSNPQASTMAPLTAAGEEEVEAKLEVKGSEMRGTSDVSFSTLGLSPKLLASVQSAGLLNPTDIQLAAIPALLEGHDAALQSYTGSGKTLAYLLPILSKVGPLRGGEGDAPQDKARGVQAVIVAPSRELAMQIVREAENLLGADHKKAVQQLIGGANQRRQEEALKAFHPSIVVGTPGRISEVSRAGRLHTHQCQWLILDEADALLSHKFRSDMLRILEHVGRRRSEHYVPNPDRPARAEQRIERQTVLVSATMPAAVVEASSRWGHKPLLIRPQPGAGGTDSQVAGGGTGQSAQPALASGVAQSLPPNLEHRFIIAPARHKVDILRRCLHAMQAKSVIAFMNYSRRLKDAEFKMEARGLTVGCLHGTLGKMARANVLSSFREGRLRVLVVSEVAARGVDVPECDLVVNLELPTDSSHYAHRAGRTGRLGRAGTVVTVCEESEAFVVQKFARQLGITISQAALVDGQLVEVTSKVQPLRTGRAQAVG